MKEAGVDVDIVEDGDTFAANALIKAKAVWGRPVGSFSRMIPGL